MKNKWKPIHGFEKYAVSTEGKIKNIVKGNVLVPCQTKNGYMYVALCANGRAYKRYVHRIVAETFLPNALNKPQVNHLNGLKDDNRIENLEWCTASENHLHRSRVLNIKPDKQHIKKMNFHAKKAHEKAIICIESGKVYSSITEAAKDIKRNKCSIVDALKGRHETCAGLHWKYFEEVSL